MGFKLEDDRYCFACGEKNPQGLHLTFNVDSSKVIHAEFTPQKIHQGFKDVTHGGFIGLVLDEVMVNLIWKLGMRAVSVEISFRLKKPAMVNKKLLLRGWIEKEDKRLICTAADARTEDGEIIATAAAKCLRVQED